MKFTEEYIFPTEIKNALGAKKRIETRGGVYTLYSWQEAKQVTILINHQQCQEEKMLPEDPNLQVKGRYCTTAYVLVSEAQDFVDPEEVLLWLPQLSLYGCYDNDTHQLYVYPDTTWKQIEANMPAYLHRAMECKNVLCVEKVWQSFDFLPLHFPAMVDKLVRGCPSEERLKDVEILAWLHERALLSHPFHSDLYDQYVALLDLYIYLARHSICRAGADILAWFNKSAIITQWLRQYLTVMR